MDKRKGFTLVELLAVIVILAIIMIIAIPSVLDTLDTARKKTFIEYVSKVYQTGLNKYLEQVTSDTLPNIACGDEYVGPCYDHSTAYGDILIYIYEIQSDLGLTSTGTYEGFVAVVPVAQDREEPEVLVGLYNDSYVVRTKVPDDDEPDKTEHKYYINYTRYGEPQVEDLADLTESRKKSVMARYQKYDSSGPWGFNSLLEDKIPEKKKK